MPAPNGRKLLVLEFNEISWPVIDRLLFERGTEFLPHFARLRNEGTWGSPQAAERPPLLDPWVTWVSVHTGVPQERHGARVLEQDVGTIAAKRTWEYAAEAGLTVGVFGSIGAFPPPPLRGFVVPGPFAPSDETHPPDLQPLQRLNRSHTQAHGGGRSTQSLWTMTCNGVRLMRLGLRTSTCLTIGRQLLRERFDRGCSWRRVALQPLVNFDFFARQYRRTRPDFATWHTNHAAHFMHHYWRAWANESFTNKGPADERAQFGEAVPLGYRLCDELIGRFLRLIDDDTILVLCSSMGQQPYQSAAYQDGKIIVRFRDVATFLRQIGATGVVDIVPTMVPQINLRMPDAGARASLKRRLQRAQRLSGSGAEAAFAVEETGDILTVTPLGLPARRTSLMYDIPDCAPLPFDQFFAADAPTVKQGMHHPEGLLAVRGRGVPRGMHIDSCTNLDLAPTFMSLLGLAAPADMSGRVLLRLNA
jgi:hypothetical protein